MADPSLDSSPLAKLPPRPASGHKGTFGTVSIVGGCARGESRMIGAPALAGLGALRAGAGLVRLACPAPIVAEAVAMAPSCTGIALATLPDGSLLEQSALQRLDQLTGECDAMVFGPGLGPGVEALALRAVQQEGVPIVVDADALNALANVPELNRDFRARAILTPHPGEFARLAKAFRIGESPTDPATRPGGAARLAQKLGCVVVLKGAGTVVSDGQRTWVCQRGHACLATAGTGDVLAGVLGALIAPPAHRGVALYDLARIGVMAHALAGERWAGGRGVSAGMLASELAGEIPAALETLRDE